MKVISYRAANGRSTLPSSVCRPVLYFLLWLVVGQASGDATRIINAESYWATPVPQQHPAPPAPETCGACHTDKHAEWSGSRHAAAFSPGLLGQIINYYAEDASDCLNCHAPLTEQQDVLLHDDFETMAAEILTGQKAHLAQHGVFCAACHLREGELHAPRITSTESGERYHKNTVAQGLLGDSQFCSGCHQFDADTAVNGKPVQNTYQEWLDSPYAEKEIGCQQCHMPDRAHLFRGIHDPEMVRQGLTIETRKTATAIELVVTSSNVGHAFPTYIVPRITLTATPLDATGHPLADARQEHVIQRLMSFDSGNWVELSDNRLKPGESVILGVPVKQDGNVISAVNFSIVVEPEWFYHERVYPRVMEELDDGTALALIKQAKAESIATTFLLFERTVINSR